MLRLCIFGTQPLETTWLERVRNEAIGTRLALFGAPAQTPQADAASYPRIHGDDAHGALNQAATDFPGEHLILLRAGSVLPTFWFARLCRALDGDDVIVASVLDNLDPARSPLPPGIQSDAGAMQIDALCYAYGRRQRIDWPTFSALLSIWHGERLREIDTQQIHKYTLPQTSTHLRGVLIDHLYVADPSRGLRGPTPVAPGADPVPPSPLGELREGVSAALAVRPSAAIPADEVAEYFGIDGKPVILHVLHGWGGGAERFVRDLAASDRERHHLVLMARGNFHRRRYGEVLELRDGALKRTPMRRLELPDPIASTSFGNRLYASFLDEIVRDFSVSAVIVSSLIGHSLDALRTGLPCVFFVHDFYPLWPLLHRNLDDAQINFDANQLAADLARADAGFEFAERDSAYWLTLREAFATAVLEAKAQLIAPSRAALTIFLRLQPRLAGLQQTVIPHGLEQWPANAIMPLAAPPIRERLRLIVLGRVRRGKAAALLRELLPALSEHAELFLLGAGPESEEFFGRRDVHILLNYKRDDLPDLLARVAPDAALILPNFAETFSYTLSELTSFGIPVIATKLGAFAERIDDGRNGFLVAPNATDIIATVARLGRNRSALLDVRARLARIAPRTLDDMTADYRELLPRLSADHAAAALDDAAPERITALTRAAQLGDAQRLTDDLQRKVDAQYAELQKRSDWAMDLERDVSRLRKTIAANTAHIAEQEHTIAARTQWARDAADRESAVREEMARFARAHAQLQHEFEDRTRWALSLNAQREALEGELAMLRGSLSWRLTKPLRYTMRKLRAARVRLGVTLLRLRNAAARTRGSLASRGISGTLKRIALEMRRSRRTPPVQPVFTAPAPVEAGEAFEIFSVPRAASPRVSIVIPVYNKFEYTDACLRSLAEHADAFDTISFETILVDDCSSDVTAERVARIEGIEVVRNECNLGFIGSCNVGASRATGEFVLFLNNDTVVTAGWLSALLDCFATQPDAGLVGAKLVYPDGRLQEAGGIVFKDASAWNYGRFDDPADPRYEFRREADYCSGAAIMLPRALFEQLGGFDTRYAPAYYEDTDLAFAVRAAGKKVFFEPRSVVVHFEGITSGTDTGGGIKKYQLVNRDKFFAKWKNVLAQQPTPIHDPAHARVAASWRARGRILIVDANTPAADHDAGSLRMVNLIRLLLASGYAVSFMPENRAHSPRYTEALQALGVEALYHPYVSDPVSWLRERGAELNVVLLSRHYVAASYVGLVRLYAPQARLIFDTVDLHYLREERAAALSGNAEMAKHAARTKAGELKLMRECDVTLVVSSAEKSLLATEVPNARVEILSTVNDVVGCRRDFSERRDLVFVGGFQHPPNVDAVEWFVGDIFPLVKRSLPELQLHVIGSRVTKHISELAGNGVVVHGFVEDIAPFMDGCRVSIAPLRYGAGVKGKINTAMSYGLPVVATSNAVEGMHLRNDEDVLVADSAADYAAAILRLYADEVLWNKLSAYGLENVRAHFSFDAAQRALSSILPDNP